MFFRLFLFLPIALFAVFDLSVCSIFQNEAPYFKEWIEFHKLQGVEHFYLYNNNSTDNYEEMLQPYVDAGEVTLVDWPYQYPMGIPSEWLKIQCNAYTNCIVQYGKDSNWLAVIDIDEFLFSPSGEKLPRILDRYENYGGVGANWRMFGTSNVESIPPGFLTIECLIHCSAKDDPINCRIKSIVQPKYVLECKNAHSFLYKDGFYAVGTGEDKIESPLSSNQCAYDQLQINHYWTRTKKHFREHKIGSRMNRRSKEDVVSLWKRAQKYNRETDFSILQFVPALRNRMGL